MLILTNNALKKINVKTVRMGRIFTGNQSATQRDMKSISSKNLDLLMIKKMLLRNYFPQDLWSVSTHMILIYLSTELIVWSIFIIRQHQK